MTKSSHQVNQLAQEFLRHFETEARALSDMHELVQGIRQALIQRDADQLTHAAQQLDARRDKEAVLARERVRLKQQLARMLPTGPDRATVGELVRRADSPWREQLSEVRRRLQDEARAIRRVNLTNLAVASEMSDVLRQVIAGLTGKATSSRYERTGRMNHSDSGPVFELNY